MDPIVIGLAAFCGGILAAVLGWLESQEAFNPRKFGASLIRALVAGVLFAIAYDYGESINTLSILIAIAGGAGVDVVGNRASGAIKTGMKNKPRGDPAKGYRERDKNA